MKNNESDELNHRRKKICTIFISLSVSVSVSFSVSLFLLFECLTVERLRFKRMAVEGIKRGIKRGREEVERGVKGGIKRG